MSRTAMSVKNLFLRRALSFYFLYYFLLQAFLLHFHRPSKSSTMKRLLLAALALPLVSCQVQAKAVFAHFLVAILLSLTMITSNQVDSSQIPFNTKPPTGKTTCDSPKTHTSMPLPSTSSTATASINYLLPLKLPRK